ncbi:MAG TPA: invasin domain 3-containing protein, partial [Gemmatimonadaceae bacterium]
MKARLLVGLMSPVLTTLILTACSLSGSDTVTLPAPAVITKVGIDPTNVVAGASFSDSIRVKVTDASNFPAYGVSVAFAVTAGDGSVTPRTVITDGNGAAAAKFITGTTVGTNTATATVTGLAAVTFSITTVAPGTIIWSSIPTDTLHGVWGSSASDVWAVGNSGAIRHYNGTIWSGVSSGTSQSLMGVWGTSASDVWAVGGASGTILHYNGTSWSSLLERGQPGILYGVWGGSASDVWVVG